MLVDVLVDGADQVIDVVEAAATQREADKLIANARLLSELGGGVIRPFFFREACSFIALLLIVQIRRGFATVKPATLA